MKLRLKNKNKSTCLICAVATLIFRMAGGSYFGEGALHLEKHHLQQKSSLIIILKERGVTFVSTSS